MLRWIVTLSSLVGLLSCSSGGYNNYLPPGTICSQVHDPFPMVKSELKRAAVVSSLNPVDGDLAKLPPGDYQYLSSDFVYFQPRQSKTDPKVPDNVFIHAHADKVPAGATSGSTYAGGPVCTRGLRYPTPLDFSATVNVIKSMKISSTRQVTFTMMQLGFTHSDRIKYIFADQSSGKNVTLSSPNQIFEKGKVQYVLWQEDPIGARDIYDIRGKVDRGSYQIYFNVKLQRRDEPVTPPAAPSPAAVKPAPKKVK